LTKPQKAIYRKFTCSEVRKAANWHQEFGSSDVAQRLELPLVPPELVIRRAVPDPFRAVREEGVANFVSDRVPSAVARPTRVEFDNQTPVFASRNASVAYIVAAYRRNT
jgi:hypothetical protein